MRKRNQATSKTGDQETDEILAAMEKDGESIPTFDGVSDDDSDDDEDEESEEEDEDEADSEEEDDEGEDEEEDDDSDDDEDEESEEEDEDEDQDEDTDDDDLDEEEEDDDEPRGKIPVWQRLRDTKKQLKDAQKALSVALEDKVDDVDSIVENFSKKYGFKKDQAKDLIEAAATVAARKSGLDPKTKQAIDTIVKSEGNRSYWEKQNKEFQREFRSAILPLAKRDGINPKKAQRILQDLVFKPAYSKKSTVEIYLEKVVGATTTGTKRKVTVEGSRRRVHTGRSKSISEITPEDIDEMSDKEFEAFSDGLGKTHKSKLVRR